MATICSNHDQDQDQDYKFDACPDSLGFDVIVQISYTRPLKCYGGNGWEMSEDVIDHVWMEIGFDPLYGSRWIDIKQALPSDVLGEIVDTFNDEHQPDPEDEIPGWYLKGYQETVKALSSLTIK